MKRTNGRTIRTVIVMTISANRPELQTVTAALNQATAARADSNPPGGLTSEEQQEVARLRKRDVEVRKHEQAHKAAAGSLAVGGPRFEYEVGPDGRRYAVGGEVQLDTAPIPGDPQATLRKAQQIKRAALAPADPSPQDRRVAAEATRMAAEARREFAQQQREQAQTYNVSGEPVAAAQPSLSDLVF